MSDDATGKRMYKIGEVCRIADVQPYVLRYWETEFAALAPSKSGGGQRLYSQREIDVILRIKQLLYSEGFTIVGAKKRLDLELNENLEIVRPEAVPLATEKASAAVVSRGDLQRSNVVRKARNELRELLELLDRR